ncbi:YciI family protein [Kribbella deserti]|uniref:YciI family protein n=1 Tax=Kribbella deserti TaxID=1926257 RepID=A0ABV6QMD6_9ACTN
MILTFASQQDYDGMAGKPGKSSTWTPEDMQALGEYMTKFNEELAASGELVETRGLVAPVHSRRIRQRDGVPVVTDGPYAETQEVLAGYWILECDSFDRATEIASRLNDCPGPAGAVDSYYVDVRPIAESQDDMAL